MKIRNHDININEFIPPLVPRIINQIKGKLNPGAVYFPPFNYLPKNLNPKWILDIGANEGGVAKAAFKTYPGCNIICFEPVQSTFELLKNNLKDYQTQYIAYNKALSDFNGESVINITSTHGANSMEQQSDIYKKMNRHVHQISQESISCVKLDDISKEFPAEYMDIVKIDVEGHELKVLQGGQNFFKSKVDTIIIEIAFNRDQTPIKQSYIDIFSLLREMGFCLINMYDLRNQNNEVTNENVMIAQVDCVFRHQTRL